jgi:enamine deaminase RidA (YjgF/YER057c/UK114 family)
MDLSDRLSDLGLSLPEASRPGGAYVSVNVRGSVAYVAIQLPIRDGAYLYQGRLGGEVSPEDGYQAAQLCALNVIAQLDKHVGLKRIVGINHFDAYFQAAPEWDDSPHIIDGASDLFVKVLEERGQHARAIFGVERLPRNFCVGLTATATVR